MGVYIKARVTAPSYDSDAQAFITAANIVDSYQKDAVNTLVLNLKAASIWTKMKAIYPFVGGTATTHKWNLKDPRDLDAAFRLVFNGGWTHSSTGAKPNGTNAYADTFLVQSSQFANDNNIHLSYYSRTNATTNSIEIGCYDNTRACQILIRNSGIFPNGTRTFLNNLIESNFTDSNSLGLYTTNRIGTSAKIFKNNTLSSSVTNAANGRTTISFYIGAQNYFGLNLPSPKECAFSTIGEGLTDTEALVFNQIVEGYQYALYRNVNPVNQNYYNSLYQNETNTFLYASEITDNTQKSAVNTLVNDLKAASIWTKMKAIYPMVGGTATTHKFNLKNPALYEITWVGGVTHNANGVTGNGTNGYGDTGLNPNSVLSNVSIHLSAYARTAVASPAYSLEICSNIGGAGPSALRTNNKSGGGNALFCANDASVVTVSNTLNGFILGSKTSNVLKKIYRNGTVLATNTATDNGALLNANLCLLGAPLIGGLYTENNISFTTIGDGLDDTETTNLYSVVQNFNTTLARQV
jgi:hypothetical protein